MGIIDWLLRRRNNTQYILSKLQECSDIREEIDIINSLLSGPKFIVMFDNLQDATRFHRKISYAQRLGTLTYIRPYSDGFYLFTGGKVSYDEALEVYNAIRAPESKHKSSVQYDWKPPEV